jgi:hypothetical protein
LPDRPIWEKTRSPAGNIEKLSDRINRIVQDFSFPLSGRERENLIACREKVNFFSACRPHPGSGLVRSAFFRKALRKNLSNLSNTFYP